VTKAQAAPQAVCHTRLSLRDMERSLVRPVLSSGMLLRMLKPLIPSRRGPAAMLSKVEYKTQGAMRKERSGLRKKRMCMLSEEDAVAV